MEETSEGVAPLTVDEKSAQLPVLRSVHTASFAHILAETESGVLVTTYKAGKLIILRSDGAFSTRTSATSRAQWASPPLAANLHRNQRRCSRVSQRPGGL
jgi:hypothetical protein